MTSPVRIVADELLAREWGSLRSYTIDYTRRDGGVQRLRREVYDHGLAAAVLLHCPETDKVMLVRQFRLPPYLVGRDGFLLEACAGLLDDDPPDECARREAREETGIEVKELRHAFDTFVSPGSLTELISCFIGAYDATSRTATGGGLAHEGEDIEIVEIGLDDALAMTRDGRIIDAKTIALLQYLALER